MRKIGIIILCVLASSTAALAQDMSNRGKDFWLIFPAHIDALQATLGIYITSDVDASGVVSTPSSNIPFTIKANTVKRIFIGPNGDAPNNDVYQDQVDGIKPNSAVHVTATKPVVVYGHIIRQARSGASLILPSSVWGKEYIVPSYRSSGVNGQTSGLGTITVVAKDTNTTVEITPKAQGYNNGRPANVPFTITLAKPGDVYQLLFVKDADISGTTIKSVSNGNSTCKPIGVVSSSTWSAFDCTAPSGGDNLYQQLFPVRSFGRTFVTAPFYNRNYDIIRVFVTDLATIVKRTENGTTTTLSGLTAAGYYEFKTKLPNMIAADGPISVVQYITSQSCNPGVLNGDPEMVILSPVEQTVNNITVFSAHQNFVPVGQSNVNLCYLNVILKTNATGSFRINNAAPKGNFISIAGTSYSYLQEDVSTLSATNPVQTLSADSSFSAIAYGYGNVESYGYNAGTNVRDLYQYISIKNQLATVSYPSTCVNTPFQFSITLPYKASKLSWQFYGAFPNETQLNPVPDSFFVKDNKTLYLYRISKTFSFPATGTYPISVFAVNPTADGCDGEQQIDYDLVVFGKPSVKFNWKYSGCVTDPVAFADSSFGPANSKIINWNWQFSDNTSAIISNPQKSFTSPGVYTVKESIATDMGCLNDSTATIEISSLPVASFTANAPFCSGNKINFKDASTIAVGKIVKWIWDYGNGKTDTLTSGLNAAAVYASGTYTVSLTVVTSTGCTSKAFTQTITVTDIPIADFILPAGACLPKAIASFTNSSSIPNISTNPLSYQWSFGDGGTDIATSPQHIYTTAGPFQVKLITTSKAGCVKDTTKTFSAIFQQPAAAFTGKAQVCLKDSSIFTDASTAVNQSLVKYYWDRGNGTIDSSKNQSFVYAAASNFTIKHWAVSDKGCFSDTATKQQIVNAQPIAGFALATAACEAKPVNFVDKSSPAGSITRWQWNLGDGNTKDFANGNSFAYTYPAAGNYKVSLVVTSSTGCKSDTTTNTVNVDQSPVANFGLPEICLTDALASFTDSSTNAGGGLLTYRWKFGDGNASAANPDTSILKNPVHKYTAVGNYAILLAVSNNNGCTASASKTLTVNGDNPKADFDIVNNNVCSNKAVSIVNNSNVNFGNITKIVVYWNWPSATEITTDNSPAIGKIYQYNYAVFATPATKAFSIKMVAYSGGVCQNELTKTVTLSASPQINFAPIASVCPSGTAITLTQASVAGNIPGSGTYSGPGITAGNTFTPAAAGSGKHTITYVFNSTANCSDTASQTLTVFAAPAIKFGTTSPVCETQSISISDSSAAGAGKIISWSWDFGDGTSTAKTSAAAFTKTYAAAGTYTIGLTVTTDSACISQPGKINLKVNPLPVVDFALPANVCVNTAAVFTDNSSIADGSQSLFTYKWTFGSTGITANSKNPSVVFPAAGNHLISLAITSKDGCTASANKTLTNVLPQPLANFSASALQACANEQLTFTDNSNPLSQTITSRNWSFGDGTSAGTPQTAHSWQTASGYKVSFSYVTSIGCKSDTASKQITVNPVPVVNAGPDIFILQGGQKAIQASVTGGSSYQYLWSPGTWLNSTSVLQPTVTPLGNITYTLKVISTGGCTATDEVDVKYLENPVIPNAFSPNGDGINDTWNIKYIDSYADATITVFDRYGRQVYAGKGGSRPWDGRQQGRAIPAGVYYFVIDLKVGRPALTGSLTILQ